MEVADAKRPQALEAENAKLMKMLVEQVMDEATLLDLLVWTSGASIEEESRDWAKKE